MNQVKVVAVGSPFADDQIAWLVAEGLQRHAQLTIDIVDRPSINLLQLWQGQSNVCLIDALLMDAPLGSVHCFTAEQISQYPTTLSSHAVGVQQTIALAEALQQLPEKLSIYGIVINEPKPEQQQLSLDLIAKLDDIIEDISQRIENQYA